MTSFLSASIQLTSSDCIEENLAVLEPLMRQAAAAGANIIHLPENFACFGGKASREIGLIEMTGQGQIRKFLMALCAELRVWCVAGTVPVASEDTHKDGRVFTRTWVFDPQGQEAGCYDKRHLFDVDVADDKGRYRESHHYRPGDQLGVVDTPFGRMGLALSLIHI